MKTPFFTIIVPVYNVAEYLERNYESIRIAENVMRKSLQGVVEEQDIIEIILVDDGSTDGSANILASFEKDRGVKILKQNNRGVGAARNNGLNNAKGDWILFLDADDSFVPQTLRYLYDVTTRHEFDLIHFGYHVVSNQNQNCNFVEEELRINDLDDNNALREAFANSRGMLAWNVCCKKSVIGDLRFNENLPVGEDTLWGIELFVKISRYAGTSTRLYKYYQRKSSAIHQVTMKSTMSAIESFALSQNVLNGWRNKKVVKDIIRRKYFVPYCYQIYSRIRCLNKRDYRSAWTSYAKMGCEFDFLPLLVRFVFMLGISSIFYLLVYFPVGLLIKSKKTGVT